MTAPTVVEDGGAGGGAALAPLVERWRELVRATPGLRARDGAAALGVSEAELVAARVGDGVVRLAADPVALLHGLAAVGRCMALTRCEQAVSEVHGTYGGVEVGPHVGKVVGEGVDLRVFPGHWRHAFALREPHPRRIGELQRSVQVFDGHGVAVHKVYLQPEGDAAAWDDLVVRLGRPSAPLELAPVPTAPAPRPDGEIDRAAFVAGWDAMADTHEFFHLLREHRLGRTQALRLAGPGRARPVPAAALDRLLRAVADLALPIMIFVGNRGCLQIFGGRIRRVVTTGAWLNVLDPAFNLHLREDRIAEAWIVAKPTRAGMVTSLELYDADGETIALVFRQRDDRERAEDPTWSALLERSAAAA